MNPDPLLLAVHVTLALGLTILLGTQSVELGRLRASSSAGREHSPASTNIMAVASIPVVTLVVMMTGGMLLGAGARGGPWVGAGVFSSVIIMASAIWALVVLRRSDGRSPRAALLTAVQWGTPAFTLAATFLMAYRPDTVPGTLIPVVLAVLVSAAGYLTVGRARPASS